MELAVIGTGYVGLVAGTCLAELGHHVTCVDNDRRKVDMLRDGQLPIYEPGLEELVPANVAAGRLRFDTDLGAAVRAAEVVFIAVGTPPGPDGAADLSHVNAVAAGIGAALDRYKVVAVKSTVTIGTCENVRDIIAKSTDVSFDVVSNPEFLREGVAVPDFLSPDRIVLGVDSERAREIMRRLYAPLTDQGAALITMGLRSAELTKYTANAMLATRISFMNEIANLCEVVGADIESVRIGVGSDSRIGEKFLYAGSGYGGSCFPKDVKALIRSAREAEVPLRLLAAVEQVNAAQKERLLQMVQADLGQDLSGHTIAVWGLAFKPDTDDMREAPSLTLIAGLLAAGARVRVHDPAARDTAHALLGDGPQYQDDPYDCLPGASALLLVTEWEVYREPDWPRVKQLLAQARVYDGRNVWEPTTVKACGFSYRGIGRR